MNNQLINLAEAIQKQIKQSQIAPLSVIEKDILLQDIRDLYRLITDENTAMFSLHTLPKEQAAAGISPDNNSKKAAAPPEEDNAINTQLNDVAIDDLVEDIQKELQETKQEKELPATEEKKEELISQTAEITVETIASSIITQESKVVTTEESHHLEEKTTITEEVINFNATEEKEAVTYEQNTFASQNNPSLNDSFGKAEESASINQKTPTASTQELHNFIAHQTSFSALLDFNSRVLFTRELFKGDTDSCNTFIAQLERCHSLDEAKTLVNSNALAKGWKGDNEGVKSLIKLVRQFYS